MYKYYQNYSQRTKSRPPLISVDTIIAIFGAVGMLGVLIYAAFGALSALLTAAVVFAKLLGYVSCEWLIVFAPLLITLGAPIAIFLIVAIPVFLYNGAAFCIWHLIRQIKRK